MQGDNPAEKTSMGENPKANLGKQPCKENKAGRQPWEKQGRETALGFQVLISRFSGGNHSRRQGDNPAEKIKRHGGWDLTLGFYRLAGFGISDTKRAS
jgi:hypothetical protein